MCLIDQRKTRKNRETETQRDRDTDDRPSYQSTDR